MRRIAAPGIVGETVTETGDLTIVRWTWTGGARSEAVTLPFPRHVAVQSGAFTLTTPEGERLLSASDSASIPVGALHQLHCRSAGVTLDEVVSAASVPPVPPPDAGRKPRRRRTAKRE
ncbi:cupin domain-containing protein [Falsigemmobacter faecalis]|uniref:Cupin n=1 Tax=Falsigemmobacter faecalis TaxID=2488730 RepID=A0A3P3DSQ5_9RHOB|nr:hypothetical protein [Falsigemmobacter faecalis]RRH77259.1 hypothetical protein EG244_03400 [Falsigemmobacter faecalis]